MGRIDKVKLNEAGKRKLKEAYKEANLTQDSLAQKAGTNIDAVKRLLGTKSKSLEGVDRWTANNIAGVVGLKLSELGMIEDCQDCILQNQKDIDTAVNDLNAGWKVDLTRLENSLKSHRWRQADQMTNALMLKVSSCDGKGWITDYEIKQFPCEVLAVIDQLWLEHSNKKFGFSVQKEIWQRLEGKQKSVLKTFQYFGYVVGWRIQNSWIVKVQNSIDAPEGHLPSLEFGISRAYLEGFWEQVRSGPDGYWNARSKALCSLVSKLTNCKIV